MLHNFCYFLIVKRVIFKLTNFCTKCLNANRQKAVDFSFNRHLTHSHRYCVEKMKRNTLVSIYKVNTFNTINMCDVKALKRADRNNV